MVVTLAIDEPLASRLQAKAAALAEQAELQWLQDAADRRLEARDRELLAQLPRTLVSRR
jgi:hypothetical protein